MPAPPGHRHRSEREPGGWICCAPCAGLMFIRQAKSTAISNKLEEAHAIRKAAGIPHSGGMTNGALVRGLKVRYGFSGAKVGSSFSDFWQAFKPGTVAAVSGRMGVFPAGHRLRRWDPGFTGYHKVFLFRFNGNDVAWWDDPLAPMGVGYVGEKVSKDELRAFIKAAIAAGGRWTVAPVKSLLAVPLPPSESEPVPEPLPPILEPFEPEALPPLIEPTPEPIPGPDLPVPGREVPRERHVAPTPLTGPTRPI